MRNTLILVTLIFCCRFAHSQALPDTFSTPYLDVLPGDTIKAWFDSKGSLTDSACADYYRVNKVDTTGLTVTGKFKDFYADGQVMFESAMINGELTGLST